MDCICRLFCDEGTMHNSRWICLYIILVVTYIVNLAVKIHHAFVRYVFDTCACLSYHNRVECYCITSDKSKYKDHNMKASLRELF